MRIERISCDQLLPAPYNPRQTLRPGDPGWERLRRSLVEFELVQPIVWNRRTGHVVSGHQRLEVLKHDGATEVDCVVVDLPLEREQALNVTLNNRRVGSDWDPDKLLPLLAELQDLPDFDATLTGYDAQEIQDLLFRPGNDPITLETNASDAFSPNVVTVTLEVPARQWEQVRASLDRLLAEQPEIALHVHPGSTDARDSP